MAAFPILNTAVPQVGQMPLVAGFPFLNVTCWGSLTSTLLLHFRHHASNGITSLPKTQELGPDDLTAVF